MKNGKGPKSAPVRGGGTRGFGSVPQVVTFGGGSAPLPKGVASGFGSPAKLSDPGKIEAAYEEFLKTMVRDIVSDGGGPDEVEDFAYGVRDIIRSWDEQPVDFMLPDFSRCVTTAAVVRPAAERWLISHGYERWVLRDTEPVVKKFDDRIPAEKTADTGVLWKWLDAQGRAAAHLGDWDQWMEQTRQSLNGSPTGIMSFRWEDKMWGIPFDVALPVIQRYYDKTADQRSNTTTEEN